ncbi:membrane complex biogenesis protein, BtpA family [Halalkaliarchaeum desulfuricum]|uniref:Membrane complex biogenesis protein, BtpA family n=1 Tax=Halalkaliarchaeum desulfuricum TaxID=2055893 RepID=A0A343TLK7_9EURY|nr:BtpA/SgcQ family protein [Halalkaliarchaeum desulfuricum]AUX09979.1 membrane complex biogenesis protein, BtpA family [Halalkaliarchaeum desulfuricum]
MNVRNPSEFLVIGMVHLPPLPGAPDSTGIDDAVKRATADADALERGGVDAVLVENFGDAPFYPDEVPKHTVASMTRIATELQGVVDVPVGINVLRNDVPAAVAVAGAIGGQFVRANVHAGARITDQGDLQGRAHETIRLRERIDPEIAVLADVDVKHSQPISPEYDPLVAVEDVVERGLADGVLVSGSSTGTRADPEQVSNVRDAVAKTSRNPPVFVGSGVTVDNVERYLDVADGAIVGSAFKSDGNPRNPVEEKRVEALVRRVRREG